MSSIGFHPDGGEVEFKVVRSRAFDAMAAAAEACGAVEFLRRESQSALDIFNSCANLPREEAAQRQDDLERKLREVEHTADLSRQVLSCAAMIYVAEVEEAEKRDD